VQVAEKPKDPESDSESDGSGGFDGSGGSDTEMSEADELPLVEIHRCVFTNRTLVQGYIPELQERTRYVLVQRDANNTAIEPHVDLISHCSQYERVADALRPFRWNDDAPDGDSTVIRRSQRPVHDPLYRVSTHQRASGQGVATSVDQITALGRLRLLSLENGEEPPFCISLRPLTMANGEIGSRKADVDGQDFQVGSKAAYMQALNAVLFERVSLQSNPGKNMCPHGKSWTDLVLLASTNEVHILVHCQYRKEIFAVLNAEANLILHPNQPYIFLGSSAGRFRKICLSERLMLRDQTVCFS